MTRKRLYLILSGVGLCLIVSGAIILNKPLSEQGKRIASAVVGQSKSGVYGGYYVEIDDLPKPPKVRKSKRKWIRKLYESLNPADWEGLNRNHPHPKEVEILVEGMDAFSAVKHLHALREYSMYLREYAGRAAAENPSDFDVLLFYAQTLLAHHEEEAEAMYRRLLEMYPNSIQVTYGLGNLIRISKPKEALELLEKVIQIEPQNASAYKKQAVSYRTLGRYDEAIASAQKANDIHPGVFSPGSFESFLQSIERHRAKQSAQLQASEPDPDESTSVASSKKTDTPQVADVQEESVKKTASDSEPSESRGDTRKAEARQAMEAGMEAEFEQMLADYERMIVGDLDPSAIVERQIADLERSVEPKLNQSEDYIKLGEAYEEAGEREKAEEVYRRARERFPDDERVRRKAEASEKRRKRSTDAEPSEEED